ncbi:thioredoxin domain-containing protein, partial [bacterium]|nr:thioredoxin domain-containing protein [bacterium]
MIAALATASRALGKIDYGKRAKNAADFILSRMSNKEGRLFHRYKDGEAAISGFLDDYAFISWGLIELYETVFEE